MTNPIFDYASADDALDLGLTLVLPGKETRLNRNLDGSIGVNYRGTDVVTYTDDNKIILNTGTWFSQTTMRKMNDYLPSFIEIRKGEGNLWQVWLVPQAEWTYYVDGMVIDLSSKRILGDLDKNYVVRAIELQKEVQRYVDTYMTIVDGGTLYQEADIDALSVNATERRKGEIKHLTANQANRVMKADKFPPALLERAIMLEQADPFVYQVWDDAANFPREHWRYVNSEELPKVMKFFRRALKRMLNKSLELPL